MSDEEFADLPPLPGYLAIEQVASLFGVTKQRVYQYVDEGRLHGFRAGNIILLPEEEVHALKRLVPGRPRVRDLAWRKYQKRVEVLGTDIQVRIREGQQKNFTKKLDEIRGGQRHIFKGAIGRYIFEDRDQPDIVNIWLVWKNTDMPDEETHQQELDAFKEELADVLDWDTAKYTYKKGLIYT